MVDMGKGESAPVIIFVKQKQNLCSIGTMCYEASKCDVTKN